MRGGRLPPVLDRGEVGAKAACRQAGRGPQQAEQYACRGPHSVQNRTGHSRHSRHSSGSVGHGHAG